jgi:hypothetical protein
MVTDCGIFDGYRRRSYSNTGDISTIDDKARGLRRRDSDSSESEEDFMDTNHPAWLSMDDQDLQVKPVMHIARPSKADHAQDFSPDDILQSVKSCLSTDTRRWLRQ